MLQVYISKDYCFNCQNVYEVVEEIEKRLPGIAVEIIDLNSAGVIKPAAIFAVPTYLWEGRVISLGNPEPAWLADYLAEKLPGPGGQTHE